MTTRLADDRIALEQIKEYLHTKKKHMTPSAWATLGTIWQRAYTYNRPLKAEHYTRLEQLIKSVDQA